MKFYFDIFDDTIDIIPNIRLCIDFTWDLKTDKKKYYLSFNFIWLRLFFQVDFRKKDN